MLVGIVAVLTALVVVLLWLMNRKDEDLRKKNDVIIYEVRRNQSLIDKAVASGHQPRRPALTVRKEKPHIFSNNPIESKQHDERKEIFICEHVGPPRTDVRSRHDDCNEPLGTGGRSC